MANAVPIGAQKNATIETKFTQKKCKKVKKKMIHCSLMVLFKTKTATCWFHIFLTLHTCYDWDSYISAAPRAQLRLPGHFYSKISRNAITRVIIIFLFHRILLSLHVRYVYVMQCPPVLIRFLNAFLANKKSCVKCVDLEKCDENLSTNVDFRHQRLLL